MSTRGGHRAGAGRPTLPPEQKRESITIRLPRWILTAMPEDRRSYLVEKALIKHLKLKPPVNT